MLPRAHRHRPVRRLRPHRSGPRQPTPFVSPFVSRNAAWA